jgi:hypothetical protein
MRKELSLSERIGATTASEVKQRPMAITMAFLLIASFFSAAVALDAGASYASAQGTDTSLAEAVPAESVFFMEIELDQQSDQWVKTFELLERAGLSNLVEQEADASPEEVAQLAETFDVNGKAALVFSSLDLSSDGAVNDIANEASSLTTDPMSVADNGIPEGFAVVFQPEDPAALYANLQNVVAGEADDNGATVETTDYNGVTIEYWESTDEFTDPTAVAQVGDVVVLSVRPADIEPIIDTVNGDVDSLATTDGFTAVQDALNTEALVFGFVNAEQFIDAAVAQEPALADSLDQVNGYAGWNVWADDAGFRLDTIQVPADGADLPELTPFEPTLAENVPADSLLFVNSNDLAGTGIFDLLGVTLQEAFSETDAVGIGTPTTDAVATPTVDEVYAQLEAQLGFNLQTDLFDQLNGEYGMALSASDVFSDAPDINAVFVSDVEDEVTVSDVTDKISFILTSALGDETELTTHDVTGGSVYSIEIPDAGMPLTLEYGVINGQLLIGVNHGIDAYVDGPSNPLADDQIYQDTLAALPQEDITGIQFLNLSVLLPMIEEGATAMSGSMDMADADESCGDYATQEEAQAAYDLDDTENWMLDMDFDGEACEDYFDTTNTVEASPASVTEDLSLLSIGTVSYSLDGNNASSTILLIGD